MSGPVESWSVADVENFLASLDLGHLAPLFKTNGISGRDLLTFGNTEYMEDLGCTRLQMLKIRRALIARGAPIKADDNDPTPAQPAPTANAPPAIPPRSPVPGASASPAAPPSFPGYPAPSSGAAYPGGSAAPPAAYPGAPSSDAYNPFASNAYPAPQAPSPYPPQSSSASPYSAPSSGPNPYPNPSGYPAYPTPGMPASYPGAPQAQAPAYGAPPAAAAVAVAATAAIHHDEREREKHQRAHQLLRQAHGELEMAERALHQASNLATAGMFNELGGHRGGPMMHMRQTRNEQMFNVMESRDMKQASELTKHAGDRIYEAKMLVPALPDIDMAVVNSLRPGIVFPGGMATDIVRKRKIEETLRHVDVMKHQTHRAMAWLSTRL